MRLGSIRQPFGERVAEVQPIEDNWIELEPGWLTDAVLKLRLWTTNGKEYDPRGANLHLKYEPAIDPDHLIVPPSEKTQEIRRMNPRNTEDDIRSPVMASSSDGVMIEELFLRWAEPSDGTLRIKIERDRYGFELASDVFAKLATPVAVDQPKQLLLYMIQSLAKIHGLCGHPIETRVPNARRLEICVTTDAARNFFGLTNGYAEVEPGWVRVSGRNSVR